MHAKDPAWDGPAGIPQNEEDVQVWLHMTTLPDAKKGGAMRMALGGVAKEAARIVPDATLMTASGHDTLMKTLRSAFGGSDFKRGQDAYRHLKTLYRGTRTMEAYLAAIGQALARCTLNGYSMSSKTAGAIVLDQAGLEANQQASTVATAAVHAMRGSNGIISITTALRDLWGGNTLLQQSPQAAMMVVTFAEHAAYVARQTTPTVHLPPGGGGYCSRGPPRKDAASCWHCGKSGHVRQECRKLARELAGRGDVVAPPAPGGNADTAELGSVAHESAHIVHSEVKGVAAQTLDTRVGDVILDIGATASIAGAAWVAAFVARLTTVERSAIRSIVANSIFTFGGGAKQRSRERVTLPLLVGGCRCLFATCVVAGDLPLLLSRKTMASLGVVLDVDRGFRTVGALDVVVRLTVSSAGHLTFNALAPGMGAPAVVDISDTAPLHCPAVLTKHTPDLDRAAAKLHSQYGHSSAPRLQALLRQAKVTDGEVFAAVTAAARGCDVCARTGPRPSRPLVSIPRALQFNDAVAVDLAEVAPQAAFSTLWTWVLRLPRLSLCRTRRRLCHALFCRGGWCITVRRGPCFRTVVGNSTAPCDARWPSGTTSQSTRRRPGALLQRRGGASQPNAQEDGGSAARRPPQCRAPRASGVGLPFQKQSWAAQQRDAVSNDVRVDPPPSDRDDGRTAGAQRRPRRGRRGPALAPGPAPFGAGGSYSRGGRRVSAPGVDAERIQCRALCACGWRRRVLLVG